MDDRHNVTHTRFLGAAPRRAARELNIMAEPPVTLSAEEQQTTATAFQQVCEHMGWDLHAAHVRTNHAHVVLTVDIAPEYAMAKLKAYATRALNSRFGRRERRWAAHGSTRWLWDAEETRMAVHYVIGAQGEIMALYVGSPTWFPRGYRE